MLAVGGLEALIGGPGAVLALELVVFVEDHFNITVNDEDVVPENFDSLQSMSTYVRQKQAEKASV